MKVEELVDQTKAYYCLDCGVCTASCPVARILPAFSPRIIVERTLLDSENGLVRNPNIWWCLTCARCTHRCPSGIDFPEFIRAVRGEAIKVGNVGIYAHHGVVQTIMEMQVSGVQQNKIQWARDAGKIVDEGEYYLFVGCLPYFDVIFRDINVNPLKSARNVLKILNRVGIEPVVSDEERCCGHDMLWNGSLDNFKKLAAFNIDLINRKGCKKVIFSCPEGYLMFKRYYPTYFGKLDFEVIHFYDLVAERLGSNELPLVPTEGTVTYHDPCRLGRFCQIYEGPREIIRSIPGIRLAEMDRNRESSVCCGTTGWLNCSSCSRQIQMERLKEAKATGADTLITACPKCQIHFTCALTNSDLKVEIKDLCNLLAEAIGLE